MCLKLRSWPFAAMVVLAVAASASVAVADYPATVLGDGPIGYWRLGEAIGPTAVDASPSATHLDYNLFPAGDFGQLGAIAGDADTAVHFTPTPGGDAPLNQPGTHPTIASGNTTDFGFASGQSFSFEYWVKIAPDSDSGNGPGLLCKGYSSEQTQPWYLSRYLPANGGSVDFYLRDSTGASAPIYSATNVDDDRWHQVVGVYDSVAAQTRLYIDGLVENIYEGVPPDAYGTNAQAFTLGNHFNRAFDGMLDEVAMYDSALTPAQVAAHYHEGSGTSAEPPRAELNVDFGHTTGAGGGPGGLQAGFRPFLAADGGADVTRSFASALGTADTVDVTVGGYTHFRNYAAATGSFAVASDLLSDGMLANAEATVRITLENMLDGKYEIITYHHTTQNGPNARPPATPFDVLLTDGLVANQPVATAAVMSDNASPALSFQNFQFDVVGGSPVAIDFVRGPSDGGDDHFQVPGFEVVPWMKLIWDKSGNGVWGTQHWLDENLQTTVLYPDDVAPGVMAHTEIGADVVAVAADRRARSLTVERDPLDVNPVGVSVADMVTLSVDRTAAFGANTTLALGSGAELIAGAAVSLGEGSSLTMASGSTLAAGGSHLATVFGGSLSFAPGSTANLGSDVTLRAGGAIDAPAGVTLEFAHNGALIVGGGLVDSLSAPDGMRINTSGTLQVLNYHDHDGVAMFIKQGPGTLVLDNTNGTIDLDGSDVWVDEGTLEATGADPLGGATSVVLNGGTLSLFRAMVAPGAGPDGGLVAHWPMNETSGAGVPNAANPGVNDGTLQGADDSAWVAGKAGNALAFDGVDDIVVVSQDNGLPIYNSMDNTYSVAMWVKGLPQNDMRVFSEGSADNGSPLLNIGTQSAGTTGQLDMFIRDDSGAVQVAHRVSNATVFDDTWHHVAWVEEDGAATLYVDGLPDPTDFNYTRSSLTLNRTSIGGILRAEPSHFFTGMIDEVYAYDRALGADEVAAMAGSGPMDVSGVNVTVSSDSTLTVTASGTVAFAELGLGQGVLTLQSTADQITFTNTLIDDGVVGFNTLVDTRPGPIDDVGQGSTIIKTGPADLILDGPGTGLAGSVFDVQDGRLIPLYDDLAIPLAELRLSGGEVALGADPVDDPTVYDNALSVEANSTLSTGSAGNLGPPGPRTVAIGSDANGVTLNNGIVEVKATDDYRLEIAGQVTGAGGMRATEGTIAIQRSGDFGSLAVAGAELSTAGELDLVAVSVSEGTLDMGADANVQTAVFSGGVINTGASRVVVSDQMRIEGTSFGIDGGNTFAVTAVDGTDLLAGHDVTLSGGELSVSSGGSLIGDAVGIWTFDSGDVVGNTVVNRGTTGTAADAAMFGGATIVTGHLGGAVSLDGLDGTEIVIPDHDDFEFPAEQSFTISMWYRHFEEAPSNGMITKGYHVVGAERAPSYYLTRIEPGGVANLHSRPTAAGAPTVDFDNTSVNLADDAWHQVTLVRDSEANEIRLYADNIPAVLDMGPDDQNGDWDMGVNDMPLVIGNHHARFTPGMFDDVLIFRRALGEEDVAALWGEGSGPGSYGAVEMPNTNLVVTADAILALDGPLPATFGNLTLDPDVTFQITGAEVNFADLTAGHEAAISGMLAVGGELRPDGRLNLTGGLEFGENATYVCETRAWDSENVPDPWNPIPPTGPVNDRLHVVAGDVLLGGTLELAALDRLSPPHELPGQPGVMVEWYGDQTRVIASAQGESTVLFSFDNAPDAQPEVYDLPGTGNWGQGHIGHGAFLTRNSADDPVVHPGITYDFNATQVHLFQAADGDTNGDRRLGSLDIQAILSANTFPDVQPTDWVGGDFTGDGWCNGLDIQAILSTGLYPFLPGPYAAVDPGDPGDQVVDLLLYPEDVTLEDGTVVPAGTLMIDPDGLILNGYVLRSEAGIFTGAPAQQLNWFFVEDTDRQISGNMGAQLSAVQDLGAVIGPEWTIINPFDKQEVNPFDDLTLTYTVVGTPGTFVGNLIVVPEPGTMVMLLCAAVALLPVVLRRRR